MPRAPLNRAALQAAARVLLIDLPDVGVSAPALDAWKRGPLKAMWKMRARQLHPDRVRHIPEAEATKQFQRTQSAYQDLKDAPLVDYRRTALRVDPVVAQHQADVRKQAEAHRKAAQRARTDPTAQWMHDVFSRTRNIEKIAREIEAQRFKAIHAAAQAGAKRHATGATVADAFRNAFGSVPGDQSGQMSPERRAQQQRRQRRARDRSKTTGVTPFLPMEEDDW